MSWPFRSDGNPDPKAAEQQKAEQEEFVKTLRSSFQEDLKPLQDKLNAYEQRFGTIEEKITAPPARRADRTQILRREQVFYEDEDKAFAERVGPLVIETVQLKARLVENDIIAELKEKGWGEFIPDIRKVLADTPVTEKAKPTYEQYVRGAAEMVFGKKAMEGGLRRDKQRFVFAEDESSSSNANDPNYRQIHEESTDGRVDILAKSGGDVNKWAAKLGIKDVTALMKEPM